GSRAARSGPPGSAGSSTSARTASSAPRSPEPPAESGQEPVEAPREAGPTDDRTDRQQRPGDIRRGCLAGVLANRQPLAVGREDDLRRDDEARQPHPVHLRAGDRRSPPLP